MGKTLEIIFIACVNVNFSLYRYLLGLDKKKGFLFNIFKVINSNLKHIYTSFWHEVWVNKAF